MKQIEEFKLFIKNKICKVIFEEELKIHDILLCYKLKKFNELEEELEEIKRKIAKVNYDPKQIKKNEKLEEDEKKYFYNVLCGNKEEKLKDLKDKESEIQIKIANFYLKLQKRIL